MARFERFVLYVGDESGCLGEFREAVGPGVVVECVNDGVEALAWLKENGRTGDVAIVLDFELPILEALGFLKGLRREEDLASSPVVLISAYAKDPRMARLGVAALVKRPVELPLLVDAVRSILPAA